MKTRLETGQILVVEDSQETQLILKAALGAHRLTLAGSLKQARECLEAEQFDLVVLDVGLPDGDGFELCREIRSSAAHSETPVLFLSGRQADVDKVLAFGEGADDYVTKPFSALELQARVRARMKSSRTETDPANRPDFICGNLRLSHRERAVIQHDGQVINLTQIEYRLLHYLTERVDVVRSRQDIIRRVWGENVQVTARTVDAHIANLRKKIGDASSSLVSAHGHGYVFKRSLSRRTGS